MNIFKVLSSNDGTITEPNVSSFLAYLLDPNENHGLGSTFLELFLKGFIDRKPNDYEDLIYNGDIRDLSRNSGFDVRVQAEVKLIVIDDGVKRKTRDIDILIELIDKTNRENTPYVFAIENKINDAAIMKGDNQLNEEVVGLLNYYEDSSPFLTFIYLTPSFSNRAAVEYTELLQFIEQQNHLISTFHIAWGTDKKEDADTTISALISRLLQEESVGKIEPMYDYTKHTLKSFVSFIYSAFKSYQEEKILNRQKSDYGQPFIQYVKDFYHVMPFDKDIHHDELKKAVADSILSTSGLTVKSANFDKSYVVNYPSRQHYGVNGPRNEAKNLFYFPNENNRTIIRKLDMNNLPEGIYIYWRDKEYANSLGKELLTVIFEEVKMLDS